MFILKSKCIIYKSSALYKLSSALLFKFTYIYVLYYCVYVSAYMYECLCMSVSQFMCIYVSVYECVCVYMCVCVCMSV